MDLKSDQDIASEWGSEESENLPHSSRLSGRADTTLSAGYEQWETSVTAAKNGSLMTGLSELLALLATLGVEGPNRIKNPDLRYLAHYIGEGSQFTVFRHRHRPIVYKRVNVLPRDGDVAVDQTYLRSLRHIQLEVLSLCHPHLRGHRNIVKLLTWGCM